MNDNSPAPLRTALMLWVAAACSSTASLAADRVDFRYAPPEWQTAICLPDDPHKSLVDRGGELLYHYREGGREFGTRIGIEVAPGARWSRQELYSARVPVVRTWHSSGELAILEEAFAVTGTSHLPGPPGAGGRNDVILVSVTNSDTSARTLEPRLVIDTVLPFEFRQTSPPSTGCVVLRDRATIVSSLPMTGVVEETQSRRVVRLEKLTVPAGGGARFCVLYCEAGAVPIQPPTLEWAMAARRDAIRFWEQAPLPFGHVEIPDPGIQALLDSSIRNIWQAREIKQGLPAFQVGPTCYRGLWIVDGAFLLEAATMLGAGSEARNGVAYELTYQQPDGGIRVMKDYPKENGIVLWTCVRHARLTQDRAWLESIWPRLERVAAHIRALREFTLTNSTPLDDGLIPPGFPDGGIGGVHAEYTNPYWNLVGLRSFIQGARWLGKTELASTWQAEYEAFFNSFRKSAARDLAHDPHGNAYLPILMGEDGRKELPQRAQWAFCHAVYPGQLFAPNDPLVQGTMAMLEATEREGMVCGTGWDAHGIWNYFASFYGHAWLWLGNGHKAADTLYAFANHAAPTQVWREEQSLAGETFRKVGDMPHNWASAEFIRLAVHLLAIDRGDELHLLEGFPSEWAGPCMVTQLREVATPFGPLTLKVEVEPDGKSGRLSVEPVAANCKALVVHLPGGGTQRLPAQEGGRLTFAVPE